MNIVSLSGDAMVNLNKDEFEFSSGGHDEWSARLTDTQLNTLLELNKCILNDNGEIVDTDPDFEGTVWGVVIQLGGAR
jgi:hypothetical protein